MAYCGWIDHSSLGWQGGLHQWWSAEHIPSLCTMVIQLLQLTGSEFRYWICGSKCTTWYSENYGRNGSQENRIRWLFWLNWWSREKKEKKSWKPCVKAIRFLCSMWIDSCLLHWKFRESQGQVPELDQQIAKHQRMLYYQSRHFCYTKVRILLRKNDTLIFEKGTFRFCVLRILNTQIHLKPMNLQKFYYEWVSHYYLSIIKMLLSFNTTLYMGEAPTFPTGH